MKYAVWGTGKYYIEYKHYLKQEDILFFIDNNEDKWGKLLDGKNICSPRTADYEVCDFILVMIMNNTEVKRQLMSYDIPEQKIKNYYDIPNIYGLTADVIMDKKSIKLESWNAESGKKNILVCSHEFSRTGVPVALMHLCVLLKQMDYNVLFGALVGGSLEHELCENNIDFIKDMGLFYKTEKFLNKITTFNMVILGSIETEEFGIAVAPINIPIIWWIHESDETYYKMRKLIRRYNIHYFSGGKRVSDRFHQYYPGEQIDELLYFLPDQEEIIKSCKKKNKITFAVIGTINRRKAQDIFIKAVELIEDDRLENVEFVMVGAIDNTKPFIDVKSLLKKHECLRWMDEMSQKELTDFYSEIDVLVCPSRDDPMPIVVTQALQNGIPCIVSSEVGQCEYLVHGIGGMVFPSEDYKSLALAMTRYINDKELMRKNGIEAKLIFQNYFSQKIMKEKVKNIMSQYIEG